MDIAASIATDIIDIDAELRAAESLQDKLASLHEILREPFPAIARIAVALYDAKTDRLSTFVHSTDGPAPLLHYEARLAEVPSLKALAATGGERILQDLSVLGGSDRPHSRRLLERQYRASYTRPFYEGGRLRGFIFYDATERDYFTPSVVRNLAAHAHLSALVVISSLGRIEVLQAAVKIAREISHYRDEETGAHLDRMARYSRLIARALAEPKGLSDEYVEFLFLFAPLHDIGKIAIRDRILLKEGKLTEEEFAVMRTHVTKGVEIVDKMIADFGMGSLPHIGLLRNIVRCHHEAVDGSGYPGGLKNGQIPLEARIVTVADVFDALTSRRPYKEPWPPDRAFAFLRERAGVTFDADCVAALLANADRAEEIRRRFQEDPASDQGFHEGYFDDL